MYDLKMVYIIFSKSHMNYQQYQKIFVILLDFTL